MHRWPREGRQYADGIHRFASPVGMASQERQGRSSDSVQPVEFLADAHTGLIKVIHLSLLDGLLDGGFHRTQTRIAVGQGVEQDPLTRLWS